MEGEKCRVSDPIPVGYTIYGIIITYHLSMYFPIRANRYHHTLYGEITIYVTTYTDTILVLMSKPDRFFLFQTKYKDIRITAVWLARLLDC